MTSGGCIFTNGTYILAGLQFKNERKIISGFGGKTIEGEESIHAALRETFEELLELFDIPQIIDDIFVHFIPKRFHQNDSYLLLEYTFEDLEDILKVIKDYNIPSPLYKTFPLTVQDLLFNRLKKAESEIECLALLPMKEGMILDEYFLSDISLLLKN